MLRLYYAAWCGACKRFAPEWKRIQRLAPFPTDAIESKYLENHTEYQVQYFPTLVWFEKGKPPVKIDARTWERVAAEIEDKRSQAPAAIVVDTFPHLPPLFRRSFKWKGTLKVAQLMLDRGKTEKETFAAAQLHDAFGGWVYGGKRYVGAANPFYRGYGGRTGIHDARLKTWANVERFRKTGQLPSGIKVYDGSQLANPALSYQELRAN